jgi:hypothetical protein
MHRIPKLFFALTIFVASAAGQVAPTSFLERRVTFTIPSQWQTQSQEDSKTIARIQILIPYPLTDNTPHSANAAIIANIVPDGVTVKEIGDRIAKQQYPGMAIVNDIPDGKNWRTIVWRARTEGSPYLMLDCFGVVNGVAVEFVVGFPLFENGDEVGGKGSCGFQCYLRKLENRRNQLNRSQGSSWEAAL